MAQTSEQMTRFWKAAKIKLDQHQCAPISSLMTHEVISLPRDAKLQEALRIFREHRLRHLVVVDEQNQIGGVFTKRDLLSVERAGLNRPIMSVANETVHSADQSTCIRKIAEMMLEYKIGCVPITKAEAGKNSLVGIVTESDFVRAFAMSTRCSCGALVEEQ